MGFQSLVLLVDFILNRCELFSSLPRASRLSGRGREQGSRPFALKMLRKHQAEQEVIPYICWGHSCFKLVEGGDHVLLRGEECVSRNLVWSWTCPIWAMLMKVLSFVSCLGYFSRLPEALPFCLFSIHQHVSWSLRITKLSYILHCICASWWFPADSFTPVNKLQCLSSVSDFCGYEGCCSWGEADEWLEQ